MLFAGLSGLIETALPFKGATMAKTLRRRSLGSALAVLLQVSGCAPALIPLEEQSLAQLRNHREILAIHYVRPPLRDTGESVGSEGPPAYVPPPAHLGPEVGAAAVLGWLLISVIEAASQAGGQPPQDYCWEDPIQQVKERFLSSLQRELGLTNLRAEQFGRSQDDPEQLREELGEIVVVDFKTLDCKRGSPEGGPEQLTAYTARSRLVQLENSQILWQGMCEFSEVKQEDSLEGAPVTLKERSTEAVVHRCADQLVAQFLGEETR